MFVCFSNFFSEFTYNTARNLGTCSLRFISPFNSMQIHRYSEASFWDCLPSNGLMNLRSLSRIKYIF